MSNIQPKPMKHIRNQGKKNTSKETLTNRWGSEITQMLELTDKVIKMIMTNMLMSLMVKIGNIYEKMGNFDKDMDSIIKN